MGKIELEGMEFYAHHGYYSDEITRGNKFVVDLSFEVDFELASSTDILNDTLDYEKVYETVKQEMATRSNLLENVGKRILSKVIELFPHISNVNVRIAKLNPPLRGIVQKVCVTLNN